MNLRTALWIACCLTAAGCSLVAGRYGPVDSRTDRPPPVIFDPARDSLPGSTIANAAAIEGIFSFFRTEPRAELDGGQVVPFFYYALHLKLERDGRYELVYQALHAGPGPR